MQNEILESLRTYTDNIRKISIDKGKPFPRNFLEEDVPMLLDIIESFQYYFEIEGSDKSDVEFKISQILYKTGINF